MLLSHADILGAIDRGELVLEPPIDTERIAQVSIDLRLGHKFTCFREVPGYLAGIHVDQSVWDSHDLWEEREEEEYKLSPGEFVLAQTLEKVKIPNNLVGLVEGRSSWARLGVTIHLTAPKIDPGFEGHITLEMTNLGKVPVILRAERDLPAQLMLLRISQPLDSAELYGSREEDNFQGQDSPIPHRLQPPT